MKPGSISVRSFATFLVLCFALNLAVYGQTLDPKAAKMKAEIQKLGTGPNARIEIELGDGRRIKGYISEVKAESFVLVSAQSGAATEVRYADASKAKKRMSKAARIVLGVGIGFAAFVGLALLVCKRHGCD